MIFGVDREKTVEHGTHHQEMVGKGGLYAYRDVEQFERARIEAQYGDRLILCDGTVAPHKVEEALVAGSRLQPKSSTNSAMARFTSTCRSIIT